MIFFRPHFDSPQSIQSSFFPRHLLSAVTFGSLVRSAALLWERYKSFVVFGPRIINGIDQFLLKIQLANGVQISPKAQIRQHTERDICVHCDIFVIRLKRARSLRNDFPSNVASGTSFLYFSFSILTHAHLANYNLNRKRTLGTNQI